MSEESKRAAQRGEGGAGGGRGWRENEQVGRSGEEVGGGRRPVPIRERVAGEPLTGAGARDGGQPQRRRPGHGGASELPASRR